MITQNKPFSFYGRNPYPRFSKTKTYGSKYTIQFEVDEEDWNKLKELPDNILLSLGLVWVDGDEHNQSSNIEVDKGEFGWFWSEMFSRTFQYDRTLWKALDIDVTSEKPYNLVKDKLHEYFETDTLTSISPEKFEGFCVNNGLSTLLSLVSQVKKKEKE